jgi:hypothetical protein
MVTKSQGDLKYKMMAMAMERMGMERMKNGDDEVVNLLWMCCDAI